MERQEKERITITIKIDGLFIRPVHFYLEILRLYCKGVIPNFFLKAEIKCEEAKNPASSLASFTELPCVSRILAIDSFFASKNSLGDRCKYFLK